jgi:hypothetical protein
MKDSSMTIASAEFLLDLVLKMIDPETDLETGLGPGIVRKVVVVQTGPGSSKAAKAKAIRKGKEIRKVESPRTTQKDPRTSRRAKISQMLSAKARLLAEAQDPAGSQILLTIQRR